jgi:hypothetical protein
MNQPNQTNVLQQNPVINNIINGQWGTVFTSVDVGLNLANNISAAQIDDMFSWGAGCKSPTDKRSINCRQAYAEAIADLLQLQAGPALIKKIIEKCHENSHADPREFPQKITLGRHDKGSCIDINLDLSYKILLQSKNNGRLESDSWVLLAKAADNTLDFIKVKVPPSVVLAHELGHFLYALETPGLTSNLSSEIIFQRINNRAQREYSQLFDDVVTVQDLGNKNNLFVDVWDQGTYVEVLNILPAARILTPENVVNRLNYSDGIVIGEAFTTLPNGKKPRFYRLNSSVEINITPGILSPNNFIRFSHWSAENFYAHFKQLKPTTKNQFENQTSTLLGKIRRDGDNVFFTVADLPQIG